MIIHIIENIKCCNVITILIYMFGCKIGIQSYIYIYIFFFENLTYNIIFTRIKKLQVNICCIPMPYNSVHARTHKHS